MLQLFSLAGRDRDVLVLLQQRPVAQLGQRLGGPAGALRRERQRERHVDDDLLLRRLGVLGDRLDVLAPDRADPPGDVQEADRRDQRLPRVAVPEGEPRVGDEVRQAVGAAEEARLGVVGEALVGAVDGGLEGQGRGGALLVLVFVWVFGCARVFWGFFGWGVSERKGERENGGGSQKKPAATTATSALIGLAFFFFFFFRPPPPSKKIS